METRVATHGQGMVLLDQETVGLVNPLASFGKCSHPFVHRHFSGQAHARIESEKFVGKTILAGWARHTTSKSSLGSIEYGKRIAFSRANS
jgi:hypothetical protein